MRLSIVFKFLGAIIGIITFWMIFPLGWSLFTSGDDAFSLLESIGIGFTVAVTLYLCGYNAVSEDMGGREAFLAVTLSWVIASAIGALPYWIHESLPTYTDAYFEAMSGFTTTGSTVLTDIEAVPDGILLWRALTHWLGGMGIIVLTLAVMPLLGVKSSQLFNAESPGPIKEKLTPRIQQTAMLLWGIYVGLSCILTLLLLAGGMNLFDSLTHAFSAISTGGFSTKNASIGHYNSVYFDWILTLFMFLSGASFALHYRVLVGRKLGLFWKDPEFCFYTAVVSIASIVIALFLFFSKNYDSLTDAFRFATFQVVSIITTTGFVTSDYELWPMGAQAIILLLLLFGGCAGSTSGGFKLIRVLVILKHSLREFRTLLSSRIVLPLRIGNNVLELPVISSCMAFFGAYLSVIVVASFFISLTGDDLLTSISSVVTTLGNAGPGFRTVGPVRNFAGQTLTAKWIFSFCMLCGRLEIYTVLVLFSAPFWQGSTLCFSSKKAPRTGAGSDH